MYNMYIIYILTIVLIIVLFLTNYKIYSHFTGTTFRGLEHWKKYIKLNPDDKINYLEIGSHSGGSVIAFNKFFGNNSETKLYCMDPWTDHEDYFEYKNEMSDIYKNFKSNIKEVNLEDKVVEMRGFSHIELHKLEDNFFDVIYIDGNHEPQFVLEDAALSFRKLKENGYMVFDDVGWGGKNCVDKGIEGFLTGYFASIKILSRNDSGQCFIQKITKTNHCFI